MASALDALRRDVSASLRDAVRRRFELSIDRIVLERPPRVALGDLASPLAFDLAKTLKQPPRKIAEEIVDACALPPGVAAKKVEGGGYVNFFLDRALFAVTLLAPAPAPARQEGKVVVEHTNINPNKAAHIGHLRNAVLGDTFVRMLRAIGQNVEVQNYIDNTGVQVADVVVGFEHLEKMSPDEVRKLIANADQPFDYLCWDLYARTSTYFKEHPE